MKRPMVEPSSPYTRASPASNPTTSIEITATGRMCAASVPAYAHAKPRIANALMVAARVRYDPPLSASDPSHPPSAAHARSGWLRNVAGDDGNEQRECGAHTAPDRELPFANREEMPSRCGSRVVRRSRGRSPESGTTARRRLFGLR